MVEETKREEKKANMFDDIDGDVSEFESNDNDSGTIIGSDAAVEYDYTNAPDTVRMPPRKPLGGKTVVIEKAAIYLPTDRQDWVAARHKKDLFMKSCSFKLFYDIEGQQETYSGVRVFKRDDGKYSHPSIMRDGKSQASALFCAYARHKGKDINSVSMKEFMSFLNGKPKAVLEEVEFKNPQTEEMVKKNMVKDFVQ